MSWSTPPGRSLPSTRPASGRSRRATGPSSTFGRKGVTLERCLYTSPVSAWEIDMSGSFCRVPTDEVLLQYRTLEEMLLGEFIPGNYDPTQDQAGQLIRCAAESAIRWSELHKNP